MITFPSIRSKLWVRLLTFVVIITFLCPNLSWANSVNKNCLAAKSRIQTFFSKNDLELSEPQQIALAMAMGQLQKAVLEEGKSNITEEIQQFNKTLSHTGVEIISENFEVDTEAKAKYVTLKFSKGARIFRAYFLDVNQRRVNERLMIEQKDLRHFDSPGLEGVWFVNEKKINKDTSAQNVYKEVYAILGSLCSPEIEKIQETDEPHKIGEKLIVKDPSLFFFLASYLKPFGRGGIATHTPYSEVWNSLAAIPEEYQFIVATYTSDGEIEISWREFTHQFFTDFWRKVSETEGLREELKGTIEYYVEHNHSWLEALQYFLDFNREQIIGISLNNIGNHPKDREPFQKMYKGFLDRLASYFSDHYYTRLAGGIDLYRRDPWEAFLTVVRDMGEYMETATATTLGGDEKPLRGEIAFDFGFNYITRGGAIIQGTEAKKELDVNRSAGRYKHLRDTHSTLWEEVEKVATEIGVSLDGVTVYGIQSIVKAKNDFLHGYFDRKTNELFLSINIMQQARAYDNRRSTRLLDEYIEHELRCRGEDHQELRRKQVDKYLKHGNYRYGGPIEGFFRNRDQVKILIERAGDRGYIYLGDWLDAHRHGTFSDETILNIEYLQNKPPNVVIVRYPLLEKLITGRVTKSIGEKLTPEILTKSRIKKSPGEKLNILDDIEIYYAEEWVTLRTYFEKNPPIDFHDYSVLWNNEPQGMFFTNPDGNFMHVRTDTMRSFTTNDGGLVISSAEPLPDARSVVFIYYVIANEDLEKSYEQVRQWHKNNPLDFNILRISAEGNGRLFIPKEGALLETAVVNFGLHNTDEGRLRDIIREDTDMRDAANQYIQTVKSIQSNTQGQKIILAFDTDIGNTANNPGLLKQISEVSDLFGEISLIADSGKASLEQKIDAQVDELRAKGLDPGNIKIIVVTNKKDKFKNYMTTLVEDTSVINYVPILEILNFALTLHLEPASTDRLKDLYHAITGQALGDADIEQIRKGELALMLPPIEKISPEIYRGAIEVLAAA